LATDESEQLQQLIEGHNTAQQLALRARIIVLADEGKNHREIARSLQISHQMQQFQIRNVYLAQTEV